ncbi:MAG: shikimate dehydrogenase [Acetivibrionales bacterium]|jgi:shikimate dehydrogenase
MIEMVKNVTGKTRITGIIGNPLEHTISPQIHNTISYYMGVDLVYVPFKVEDKDLGSLISGLKAANITGVNVTVPYKNLIIKLLDYISDEASLMGAVNTVKFADGKLYGYNTDGEGFSRSFKSETGTGFNGKRIAIIGAGGAARAVAVRVATEGAKEVAIVNRTISRAEQLAGIINNNIVPVATPFELSVFLNKGLIKEYEVIINTTSAGMYPNIEQDPLGNQARFLKKQIVYDVIYNPPKTRLLMAAEKEGCKSVNGLGMLLYQAAGSYEIWTGKAVPDGLIDEIYKCFLKK